MHGIEFHIKKNTSVPCLKFYTLNEVVCLSGAGGGGLSGGSSLNLTFLFGLGSDLV